MVESTKKHFRLDDGEYIIKDIMFTEHTYKVFEDDKEISHKVSGIIVTTRE